MIPLFKNARFVTTAVKEQEYPVLRCANGTLMPEVAVVGRSNVGKSSLLNHLFHQKGLVRTSSVPGKTQLINFFTVDGEIGFVDLPGYGYAKVPVHLRRKWEPMIEQYLKHRKTLRLILFLFDIRRTPTEEDLALLDWLFHFNKATILIFTKVDKVNQAERKSNTEMILESFGNPDIPYLHYSTTKNIGNKELMCMIVSSLK